MKFRVEKKDGPVAREGEREREQKPRARGERVRESALRVRSTQLSAHVTSLYRQAWRIIYFRTRMRSLARSLART